MSNPPLIAIAREGKVATVTMQRPRKRNALSVALRDALLDALGELTADDTVHVVVLTGGASFCAGFDLDEMIATDLAALFHRGEEFALRTYFFEKPLVVAVAGAALGGGFDLALSGDVILAAEGASLGRPEIGWSINPLMTKLWHRVGVARALQMSMRGEVLTSHEALELGVVDRVVAPPALLELALAEAHRIARSPLPALRAVKRAAREAPHLPPVASIKMEFDLSRELAATGELKAQLEAYTARVRSSAK